MPVGGIGFLGTGISAIQTVEHTAMLTYSANQIALGHALNQSHNVQMYGCEREFQNIEQSLQSLVTDLEVLWLLWVGIVAVFSNNMLHHM